jgi:hypothetical protein
MISAVDFPEVFPWMREDGARDPDPHCLARWEDDGGRAPEISWRRPSADLPERSAPGPTEPWWSLDFRMPGLRLRLSASGWQHR